MKTNNKFSAYILRGSTTALLFSCVIVALCSAINLPERPAKAIPPQDNAAFGGSRNLTFAERVAYQTAIEDVYWRHRIWPDTNPGPKPALDKVMSQADIEKKVTGYLRDSQALEDYSHQPITADQLQAEMERMASHTKQPEVLRELFEALGNDPFVIAECLARPILTERLIGDVLAHDKTGRFESLRPYEPQTPNKVEAIDSIAKGVQVNRPYQLPVIASPSGGCIDDTWTPTTNAPDARFSHTAVWTGSEMIVWGGDPGPSNTGGRYNPSTDSWTATTTTNAPEARRYHTAIWTGTEMIVWGGCSNGNCFGVFNTGGRYNPLTNTWTATSTTNAPSARGFHTAVWTGSEMIVWGGTDGAGTYFNTGGRYNPSTDAWTATSTTNAPSARVSHTAVWANTTSEMIVWGGNTGHSPVNTGGRYNPSTDSWAATSTANAPFARENHTAAWTGSEMIVWGGENAVSDLNSGGRYNPNTDNWTATSTTNAPIGRYTHTAVWTSSEMIVWGGFGGGSYLNTGGRYNPSTDSWTATSTTNAPAEREAHTAVWTGSSEMIVWGGCNSTFPCSPLNTGGRYCAAAPSPTCVPPPPDMVSWWPGDGNTDDIVDGNNGTLQGGATFAQGEVQQAFSFNGVDAYVDIPHNDNLNPTGPFSVDAWVQADPSQGYPQSLIVDKSHGFTDSTGWLMQTQADGTGCFAYGLGGAGNTNFIEVCTQASILDGQWHQLAGIWTGTEVQIYEDGLLQNVVNSTSLPVNNSRDVHIGVAWGGGSPTRFFHGLVDEVEYFNRALSASEIQGIVSAGNAGKCKGTQTPTPTPSPTPTATASATATATPTATANSTPRPTPTPRPRPTPAPRP